MTALTQAPVEIWSLGQSLALTLHDRLQCRTKLFEAQECKITGPRDQLKRDFLVEFRDLVAAKWDFIALKWDWKAESRDAEAIERDRHAAKWDSSDATWDVLTAMRD